ncbi:hypothetical protein Tco_1212950 [Tanacetum coccineum]
MEDEDCIYRWQINAAKVGLRFDAHLSYDVVQSSHEGSLENGIYSLSFFNGVDHNVGVALTQGSLLWVRVIKGIHGEDGKLGGVWRGDDAVKYPLSKNSIGVLRGDIDKIKRGQDYNPWKRRRCGCSMSKRAEAFENLNV